MTAPEFESVSDIRQASQINGVVHGLIQLETIPFITDGQGDLAIHFFEEDNGAQRPGVFDDIERSFPYGLE